jgi:hypothetical protein
MMPAGCTLWGSVVAIDADAADWLSPRSRWMRGDGHHHGRCIGSARSREEHDDVIKMMMRGRCRGGRSGVKCQSWKILRKTAVKSEEVR